MNIAVRKYLLKDVDKAVEETLGDVNIIGLPLLQDNHEQCLAFARKIKKINSDIIIVLGNIDATVYADYIMKHNTYIDYIITGDGEQPLRELCSSLIVRGNVGVINGIVYRDGGRLLQRSKVRG